MSDQLSRQLTPDEARRFDRALRRLRRPRRNMLLWSRKEKLSYEEIAAMYGITPDEVRGEVARALLHLSRRVFGAGRPWWRKLLDLFG